MPFTAFPHQISDPIKLRRTLQVAKKLLKSGKGIDDPSLGYTLFLKGIIRSRGYSGTLRQQLKQIQNEEESAQSPLRIARDLRRFFLLFGFIEESKGQFQVTKRGEILIKASRSRLTKAEKKAWLEGLLDLRLPVNGTTFRPVEMMLEMLVDGPVQTKALAFAFSVASESKKENLENQTVSQTDYMRQVYSQQGAEEGWHQRTQRKQQCEDSTRFDGAHRVDYEKGEDRPSYATWQNFA